MLKLSQLLDAKRRESDDANVPDSPPLSRLPQSPGNASSSGPGSPAASVFSSRGHTRVSSGSSLISSGLGISMESASKSQLTGVKEEPCDDDATDLDGDDFGV